MSRRMSRCFAVRAAVVADNETSWLATLFRATCLRRSETSCARGLFS